MVFIQLFPIKQGYIEMLSQVVQFPKTKKYMRNLNELLDHYEQQNIQQIHQLGSARPKQKYQSRPKTFNMQRFTFSDLTNPLKLNPSVGPMKFVHSRSMSSIVKSTSNNSQRNIRTAQQARKQKMVNILSMQNVRKQLMNTRKMTSVHSQKKLQQIKIRQTKNNQYDLRFNVLKNHNLQKQHEQKQIMNAENQETQYILQLSKNQEQKNRQVVFSSTARERLNNNHKNDSTSKQTQKKQYLKKGSSINKSILNTIIRLKLSRKSSEGNDDHEKYVENDEIAKMIKVYKGVEVANTLPRSNTHNPTTKQNIERQKDPLYIEGWHNDTEQFDLNESHNPPLPQNSASCQI